MATTFPYYFFFAILGFVVGALVSWFFLAMHPFETLETPGGPVDDAETPFLVKKLADEGVTLDEASIVRVLELHGAYVDGQIAAQEQAEKQAPKADG